MNFFKTLSETGVNDVIIQYAKESNQITVIVSPKNIIRNNPLLQIKPIVLTGTPEEVDTTFNDVVVKALAVAQQLHDIMEANKPKEVAKKPVVSAKKKAVVKTELTPVVTEPMPEAIAHAEKVEPLVGSTIEERYESFQKDKEEVSATPTQQEQDFVAMRSPSFVPITEDDVVIERFETESVSVGEETVHITTPIPTLEDYIEQGNEQVKAIKEQEETLTAPELLKQAVEKLPKEEPKVIPLKTSVVNNEKHLKEFVLTLKTDADWYANEAEIERLYANLSEVELGKPYPKKVRIDLDIKLRKRAIIQAARDKMMGIVKQNETPESITLAQTMKEQMDARSESITVPPLVKAPVEVGETFEQIRAKALEQVNSSTPLPPPPPTVTETTPVPPPPPSLMYTYPKAFDAEEDEDEPYDED